MKTPRIISLKDARGPLGDYDRLVNVVRVGDQRELWFQNDSTKFIRLVVLDRATGAQDYPYVLSTKGERKRRTSSATTGLSLRRRVRA